MRTSSTRSRRHRNPPVPEVQAEKRPFFSQTQVSPTTVQTKREAFFQPKLIIGEADDHYEREADAVADKVVARQSPGLIPGGGSSVQREARPGEKPGIQKAEAEKKEEEKPAIQKAEKKEEEKPAIQKLEGEKKEEEKPAVQKAEAEKKDEEKPAVQKAEKKEEEKPAIQKLEGEKKEEEKPAVQKAEAEKKEEEKPAVQKAEKKEEEKALQKKANSGSQAASPVIAAQIQGSRGNGSRLPDKPKAQMEQAFARDFSEVNIHTDSTSAELNENLNAKAFTHGKDVYFNAGKFSPESAEGNHLLAHELTHVVQQGGAQQLVQRQVAPAQPRQQIPGISTPVPAGLQPQRRGEVRTVINDVQVIIRPDITGRGAGRRAVTNFRSSGGGLTQIRNVRGRISSFQGPGQITVTIQTTYQRQANPQAVSGYGRGTTAQDQEAGDTSLRFHEGSHGTNYLEYLQGNPLPAFNGTVGMTTREFNREVRAYRRAIRDYFADMGRQSLQNTDCVGTTIDQATGSEVCVP
ncbi:MAG: hypothetical protein JWM28_1433 [Chitinophagaceae bacterium]|nr:hypothetical protein [Chitinophagaceae bacterium]